MGLESNKRKVVALLQAAFTPGRSIGEKRAAMSGYINANKYIQHSAVVPDGFDGLMSLLEKFDEQFSDYGVEVKRLIAEGDYVWAHCHYRYGPGDPRGKAIVEIFRFEEEFMVEHWDVIQEVPGEMAHPNGMF